ncbi:Probable galacturonosyltransferase-like 10 (Galactinol synthase 8) (AtGolS8) (GolS-8) [Durusdinium trenchii]|uniref:Probable galacturonosyltransferase-like 10 (Galactinol synthase 8) (AtGolS8) (GolS-8) n=1 Tax=Durusdinium trenchii TaxID=1381693 RepID=A0ABP0HBX6_9DINO
MRSLHASNAHLATWATWATCWAVVAGSTPSPAVVAEKHASELDLNCDSYEDGVDWSEVRKRLFEFLVNPSEPHPWLGSLLALGRTQTDCYIGLCCLGYLAMIFMSPEKRLKALMHTLFGSVPLWDQIPLSYWDTIHSRWPIFGLLEIVGAQVRDTSEAWELFWNQSVPAVPSDGARWDADGGVDGRFQEILEKQLATGAPLPSYTAIRFLSKTWPGCSFGKATAFLVLAERLLLVDSNVLTQAAKDFMALGEAQLDRCAVGRNVTVFEQMMSEWPFWGVLRRVEANERVKLPSEQLRTPPQYMSPVLRPAAGLHQPGGFQHPSSSDVAKPKDGNIQTISRACEARDVHVALSGDGRHMEGLLAAMQSLILGTKAAERVCVHVFALKAEVTGLLAAFRCSFEGRLDQEDAGGEYDFRIDGVGVQIHIFTESEVLTDDLVVDAGVTLETGDLNAPHNFVRFYLAKWISASRIVYLDTDVIVKGDVCELHDMAFQSSREAVLAAVPRRHLPLSFYLKVFSPKMPIWLPSTAPSFNAGVMVIDMKLWERLNVTNAVLKWARQNKDRDLWRHGSQPPLLLLLYDRTEWIPDVWNVDGLGHGAPRSPELIRDAKILHWTGPLKPWLGGWAVLGLVTLGIPVLPQILGGWSLVYPIDGHIDQLFCI